MRKPRAIRKYYIRNNYEITNSISERYKNKKLDWIKNKKKFLKEQRFIGRWWRGVSPSCVYVCACVITKFFTFARKNTQKIFAFFIFFVIACVRWLQAFVTH